MQAFVAILLIVFGFSMFMWKTPPACDPGYVPALSSPKFWACVKSQ